MSSVASSGPQSSKVHHPKCFILNDASFVSNVQKPDMVHPVHQKACDHITVVHECHGITSCAAVAQAVWKLESHKIKITWQVISTSKIVVILYHFIISHLNNFSQIALLFWYVLIMIHHVSTVTVLVPDIICCQLDGSLFTETTWYQITTQCRLWQCSFLDHSRPCVAMYALRCAMVV